MAMQVGSAGQVVSFEPDSTAFRRLKYHVQINSLSNVLLFQAAASNKTGSAHLIVNHGMGSSFSHLRYEDEPVSKRTPTKGVAAVAVDELVSRGLIRHPDLIKVDVQGHGAKALEGCIRSITSTWPIIIFSNHSVWELEGTRKLLEPFYSVCSLSGNSIPWENLNVETGILLPSISLKMSN
jgi:FkbM family methyltransferase